MPADICGGKHLSWKRAKRCRLRTRRLSTGRQMHSKILETRRTGHGGRSPTIWLCQRPWRSYGESMFREERTHGPDHFGSPFGSSIYTPAISEVSRDFHVSREIALLPFVFYLLGLSFGPVCLLLRKNVAMCTGSPYPRSSPVQQARHSEDG